MNLKRWQYAAFGAFIIAALITGNWLHWGAPKSDYQRLNALEARVEALENQR